MILPANWTAQETAEWLGLQLEWDVDDVAEVIYFLLQHKDILDIVAGWGFVYNSTP